MTCTAPRAAPCSPPRVQGRTQHTRCGRGHVLSAGAAAPFLHGHRWSQGQESVLTTSRPRWSAFSAKLVQIGWASACFISPFFSLLDYYEIPAISVDLPHSPCSRLLSISLLACWTLRVGDAFCEPAISSGTLLSMAGDSLPDGLILQNVLDGSISPCPGGCAEALVDSLCLFRADSGPHLQAPIPLRWHLSGGGEGLDGALRPRADRASPVVGHCVSGTWEAQAPLPASPGGQRAKVVVCPLHGRKKGIGFSSIPTRSQRLPGERGLEIWLLEQTEPAVVLGSRAGNTDLLSAVQPLASSGHF